MVSRKQGYLAGLALACGLAAAFPAAAENTGQVGGYLYASPVPDASVTGGIIVRFGKPGKRLVIAFGHKNRKDRLSRMGSSDALRESFKPYKADLSEAGRTARFQHLPPDFYDLVVIETETMVIWEGVDLLTDDNRDLSGGPLFDEVKKSLSKPADRFVGGWEAFFDSKRFERFETDGVRGAVFLQQLRQGASLTQGGAPIKGCIHSIDVVWLTKGVENNPGWQVMSRQQLFREELGSRDFFEYRFKPELQAVRVGTKVKDVGLLFP